MPKDKPGNFGGLPADVFNQIWKGCTTARIPPLNGQDPLVIEILAALAREEHAAANGGPGYTGVWEAIELIRALSATWNALKSLPAGANPQAAAIAVANQLTAIGKQWQDVGTTDASFFTSKVL